LKIGRVELGNNVILGPMAGITNSAFRLICRECGAGLVWSEMISVHGLVHGQRKTMTMLSHGEKEKPLIIQIFGNEPDMMAEAARIVEENGADIVDINFCCSVRKVLKNKCGSALLKDLKLLGNIVSAVARAVKVPVTVKIRSGWDRASINAPDVARAAQDSGASAVAIHPRTAVQRFCGTADWDVIKKVKQSVKIPVIGNGDVKDELDAKRMLEMTKCDAVMIARAARNDPWIFARVAHYLRTGERLGAPSLADKAEMMKRHARMLCELKGEEAGIREMRKFLIAYLKSFPGAREARERAGNMGSLKDLETLVGEYV